MCRNAIKAQLRNTEACGGKKDQSKSNRQSPKPSLAYFSLEDN